LIPVNKTHPTTSSTMKTKLLILSLVAAISTVAVSRADLIDMQALWSGAQFGNGASATATFTFDTSLFNNPGVTSLTGSAFSNAFQNLQLTVSGASAGNGVFTVTDFSTGLLDTMGVTLDFHSELVGQATMVGSWGPGPIHGISIGEFNLFSNGFSPLAPTAYNFFTLSTFGGQNILLTSFAPVTPPAAPAAVPETSTWVMGFLALGAVVFLARRPVAVRA